MMLLSWFRRGSVPGGALAVAAFLFTIAAGVAWFGTGAAQNTATHYFVLLVMVIGLGVFTGNSGVLSFGHTAFAAIGAYASALLTLPLVLKRSLLPQLPEMLASLHLDFVFALVVAVVLTTLVGLACGLFICRLGGAAAVIATLGLMIIVNSTLIGASDFTRGSQAIYGVPKAIGPLAGAALASLAYFAARWFKESRSGLLLRAVREDELAAQSVGIQAPAARLLAWCLSVALMSVGGVMFAHHIGVFSPKEFYFVQAFGLLVMLIVGGMTSVTGAVAGTSLIVMLVEILRRLEEGVSVLGLQTPQVFGLTDIGLSVAILIALYRRGTGLLGHGEVDAILPKRSSKGQPPAVDGIHAADPAVSPVGRSRIAALEARNIAKSYGGVVALKKVDIAVRPGEIVGLIGPNGSGKTTMLSCLSGIQTPTEGSVFVDGNDMSGNGAPAFATKGVGRTFQNIRLFASLTVRENVEAALLAAGRVKRRGESGPRANAILNSLGLCSLADRAANTLAYGQQRRLEIARALASGPSYLLLDEPAAGMNEAETQELLRFLVDLRVRSGIGMLLVDHDLHLIMQLCDRVVVLSKGEVIAAGQPDDVRRSPAVIEAYIGRRVKEARSRPKVVCAEN